MVADPITWPVAVTIISGIAISVVVFAGYIHQTFKNESPWKEPIERLNTLVVKLETNILSLSSKIDDVQHNLTERLEKVTDLMIDMLRVDPPSDKSDKE